MATLRELRLARGLSLEQLAERAFLDKSAISRIENGERIPTYRTRRDIAAVLHVPVEEIDWPEVGEAD